MAPSVMAPQVPVQDPQGAAPAAPVAPPSPAVSEQPQDGQALQAKIHAQMGIMMLKQALAGVDLGSREGKVLLATLKQLAVAFGTSPEAASLLPAQIVEYARAAQAQGAAPVTSQ